MRTGLVGFGLLSLVAATVTVGADGQGVRLYDTGRQHRKMLSGAAIRAKRGWRAVGEKATMSGDACVENGRIAVCFRSAAGAVELYYRLGTQTRPAASLSFGGPIGQRAARIKALHVRENSDESVRVELELGTRLRRSGSVSCVLRAGSPSLELRAGDAETTVRVRHASACVIMPDFFSDDLLLEPQAVETSVRLPGDNLFLLHLIDKGDALLMCNWRAKDKEVPVALREGGTEKAFGATAIPCRPNERLWVSVLAAPQIWREEDSADYTIYEDKEMDWQVPFEAAWRLNYRRSDKYADGLIDSWWNIRKDQKGRYGAVKKHATDMYAFTHLGVSNQKTRGSWNNGLGGNIYPFYTEGAKAVLRIPKMRYVKMTFKDRIWIYPWLRADHTPKEVVLPVDVLSTTLGDDWQKTLDIKDLKRPARGSVYPATCGVTEQVKHIFDDQKEKEKRDYIAERIRLMDIFVKNHRARLDDYVEWAEQMAAFYAAHKAAHPEQAELVEQLAKRTHGITRRFESVKDRIKTPAYAATLSHKYIELIDSDAEDKIEQCDQLGRQIRTIGGGQDGTLGSFRATTRQLRQEASLVVATDPDPARRAFAADVRARTLEMLRIRFGMEGK